MVKLADARMEPNWEIIKTMNTYIGRHKMSVTKLQDLIKKQTAEGNVIAF